MPELPEVETIKIGLQGLLPDKKITKVSYDHAKSFPNSWEDVQRYMVGATVTNVSRRGKTLSIELDSGYTLLIHLKMTGQLVFRSNHSSFGAGHPTDSLVNKLPDKSTRVIINLKQSGDHSTLFFNDQRKFGWIRLMHTPRVQEDSFIQKLGPEPLETTFSVDKFIAQLQKRIGSSIKAALLDQSIVAGIGNIYADESLWSAKIHPSSKVKEISQADLKNLHKELIRILKLSIVKGGSTDKNYINVEGKKGSYLSFAEVFRREGQPCRRCGSLIVKIRVAGRGTHICPTCQKLPRRGPNK